MQIVPREKIKCMTEKTKCEGGNKGLRGKIKGKENESLRGKKGADSVVGEIKCMRVII